jgi:hypothetical protein
MKELRGAATTTTISFQPNTTRKLPRKWMFLYVLVYHSKLGLQRLQFSMVPIVQADFKTKGTDTDCSGIV